MGAQRTEEDFAEHILHTVASDLESPWIFIVDNLNTHQSESLVALVADVCDLDENLGKRGARASSNHRRPEPHSCPIRRIASDSSIPPSMLLGSIRSRSGLVSWRGACSNAPVSPPSKT